MLKFFQELAYKHNSMPPFIQIGDTVALADGREGIVNSLVMYAEGEWLDYN